MSIFRVRSKTRAIKVCTSVVAAIVLDHL